MDNQTATDNTIVNSPTIIPNAEPKTARDDAPYKYNTLFGEATGDDGTRSSRLVEILVEDENVLVTRFMMHRKFGNGTDYNLSIDEFKHLGIKSFNIETNRSFLNSFWSIEPGTSEFISFKRNVKTNQSATLGHYTLEYSGELFRTKDGLEWSFKGNISVSDTYDFDLRTFERPFGEWLPTLLGGAINHISSPFGNPFNITGPNYPISIDSNNPIIRFPYMKGSKLLP